MSDYFERRSALLHEHSGSVCPDQCSAHCCREAGLQVEVSLADLYSIGLATHRRLTDVFEASARIGQSSTEAGMFVRQVTVELCKPCAWQGGRTCSVHGSKPLACAMFPENVYARADWCDGHVGRARFVGYPCLESAGTLSPERRVVLAELDQMLRAEFWASDLHLFACSPVFLDFGPYADELAALGSRIMRRLGLTAESYCRRHGGLLGLYGEREVSTFIEDLRKGKKVFVPHEAFTALLRARLSNSGLSAQLADKMALLNAPDGAAEFVDLVQSSRPIVCTGDPPPGMLYTFEGEEMRLVGPAGADGELML